MHGSSWWVRSRYVVGGVDDAPLGRFTTTISSAPENLALIADRQGTTLAAMKTNGTQENQVWWFSRNPFGSTDQFTGSGNHINTETGFAGASTPNATGGFVYLRNRWYDPSTGRFLTQDPIGLAGGVNLYSYAGNNPVAYTDPFGLCLGPAAFLAPLCARVAVWVLGTALPFLSRIGAAMTGLTAEPPVLAANPRAAATLGRIAATLESNANILESHLSDAAREAGGEIVATDAAGRAYDHLTEAHNAMQGLRNVISGVNNLLNRGRPTAAQVTEAKLLREQATRALERAQKVLDQVNRQ